jgi:hypothetical protein
MIGFRRLVGRYCGIEQRRGARGSLAGEWAAPHRQAGSTSRARPEADPPPSGASATAPPDVQTARDPMKWRRFTVTSRERADRRPRRLRQVRR